MYLLVLECTQTHEHTPTHTHSRTYIEGRLKSKMQKSFICSRAVKMYKLQDDGEWSKVFFGGGRVWGDSAGSAAAKSQTWPFVAGFNFSWLHTYWAKESVVSAGEATERDRDRPRAGQQQQATCYLHCHWRRNCCRYLDVQSSAKKQHTDSDDRWTGRTQRLHGLSKESDRETERGREIYQRASHM